MHRHRLRTPGEEKAFTARPKIHSHSQIFRYGIFCLPLRPNFSDIFDLCLHCLSVVREAACDKGLTNLPKMGGQLPTMPTHLLCPFSSTTHYLLPTTNYHHHDINPESKPQQTLQEHRKSVGKVGNCPHRFWKIKCVENPVTVLFRFPICCWPTQI